MTRMLVVLLTLAAAACADERALPPGDPAAYTQLAAVRDHACACLDPACGYRALGELLAYSDTHADLRETQASAALADEIGRCLDTASRAAPVAAVKDAAGGRRRPSAATGMPACDEYIALVEEYLDCDQFPQAARDSTRQATDQMRQAWRDMATMDPDIKRSAEDACRQASDAMRQAGSAMGCDLDP